MWIEHGRASALRATVTGGQVPSSFYLGAKAARWPLLRRDETSLQSERHGQLEAGGYGLPFQLGGFEFPGLGVFHGAGLEFRWAGEGFGIGDLAVLADGDSHHHRALDAGGLGLGRIGGGVGLMLDANLRKGHLDGGRRW